MVWLGECFNTMASWCGWKYLDCPTGKVRFIHCWDIIKGRIIMISQGFYRIHSDLSKRQVFPQLCKNVFFIILYFSWNCLVVCQLYIYYIIYVDSPHFAIREMQIKMTLRYHLIFVRKTKMENTDDSLCWRGYGVTGTLPHCWWESKLV